MKHYHVWFGRDGDDGRPPRMMARRGKFRHKTSAYRALNQLKCDHGIGIVLACDDPRCERTFWTVGKPGNPHN
ncbi:MAG: hypothetical protein OXE52_04955 [Chloroflexi bacterium]|nr:hypothetical protein [Chloroflexota bacterium]